MSAAMKIDQTDLVAKHGWMQRIRAFGRFVFVTDVELIASSVAFNAMLGFFPGLLLLKYAQDILGYRIVAFTDSDDLSMIAPKPVIDLVNGFLSHIADIDRVTLSISVVVFVALILKSVAGTFSGFVTLLEALTGKEYSRVRSKAVTLGAAICVLFFAALLFVIANLEALTNPAWLPERGIEQALHLRLLASMLFVIVGMAAFMRILSGATFSKMALWIGATVTSALWLGSCFLFFSYKFDFTEEQHLYGTVTAIVAMLIWFYITAYTILVGMAFSYFIVDGKKAA